MNNIFTSATLKLTVSYLLILMSVGFVFSLVIYQVASSEIDSRLDTIEQGLERELSTATERANFAVLRDLQARQAEANLFSNLFFMNIILLGIGGIASYFMARRTLEPIEQAHEAQSRFTSDASHELRTPLAAMKTELEVALRDPSLTREEMKELLTSNLEEVDKLSKISQTLLLLSRLEHNALETRRVAVDDIVRRVVENANNKKSRIVYTKPERSLYVAANQVSIEELVVILVDNALKYSPKASKIRVLLKRKGKKAELKVANPGKGIQPDDLPFIFERFYRADDSRTGGSKTGFGLGLALAKKIVEMHDGDLSVSSQPNKETVFTVSLPLTDPPSKPTKNKSAKSQRQ